MRKIKFVLVLLVLCSQRIFASDDIYVESVVISSKASVVYGIPVPKNIVAAISSKDEVLLYYTEFIITNPTKDKYDVDIQMLDEEGHTIIGETYQKKRAFIEEKIGADTVDRLIIFLALDPKLGAMVDGQKLPLQADGTEYFFRLTLEGKLIGISTFKYFK